MTKLNEKQKLGTISLVVGGSIGLAAVHWIGLPFQWAIRDLFGLLDISPTAKIIWYIAGFFIGSGMMSVALTTQKAISNLAFKK